MNEKKGMVIAVEGLDGSGKTTVIAELIKELQRHWIVPLLYRAPGGTAIGENIRSALFKSGTEPCNDALIYGMMASHAQLTHEVLIPESKKGNLIILDRYVDSTYTYQGITEKNRQHIDEIICQFVPEDFIHTTVIIDVPLDVAMERIQARGVENFLDTKPREFYAGIENRLKMRVAQHEVRGHNVEIFNNNVSFEEMISSVSVLAEKIMKEFTTR